MRRLSSELPQTTVIIMPYAVRDPEPGTSTSSKPGDVASGFWCDCLPFACSATISVAITTLDVITDCLLYRTFQEVGFTDALQEALQQPGFNEIQPMVWRNRTVYRLLPLLLQIVCLLGVLVYMLDLLWMCFMFIIERRKFKDKKDGLPYKGSVLEKYGGDVFILLHVSVHNLPVAALFLAAQLAVSCHLVLQLGHMIFYVAMLSTAVSIAWKILQIVYNSGCFGQREEFVCTTGSWVLRMLSLVLLLGALVVTSLNVVLLKGWRGEQTAMSPIQSQITDRIRLDNWLRGDAVFLALDPLLVTPTTTEGDGATNTSQSDYILVRLAGLADIFASRRKSGKLKVEMQCVFQGISMTQALLSQDNPPEVVQSQNCTVIFLLRAAPGERSVYFDFYFHYVMHDGSCGFSPSRQRATHISNRVPNISPMQLGHLPSIGEPSIGSQIKDVKSSTQSPTTSVVYTYPTAPLVATSELPEMPESSTVIVDDPDLSMATQLSEYTQLFISKSSTMECSYNLVQNTSLLLGDPCKSSM